jgi:hypothetical protein
VSRSLDPEKANFLFARHPAAIRTDQAMVISRDGGLMSWAPDLAEQHREAARYFLSLNNTAADSFNLKTYRGITWS